MKNILVPVDFSNASSNALSYALNLFNSKDLKITLLNVFSTKSTALMMKNIDDVLFKDSKQQMERLLKKFEADYPDVTFTPKILKNYPVDTIVEFSKTKDYDFIVMGTKGASGLKEVFMGSIAGGVVARALKPTIVVPDGYKFNGLNTVVLAVSDQTFENLDILSPVRDVALDQESELILLHITNGEMPQLEQVKSLMEDVNPKVDFSYGSGNVNKDLNEYLEKKKSGMVCMIRGKKSFMNRLLDKSATMKQTFSSPVPLMILHDE